MGGVDVDRGGGGRRTKKRRVREQGNRNWRMIIEDNSFFP